MGGGRGPLVFKGRRYPLSVGGPIYSQEGALACLMQFRPVAYGQWQDVAPGFRARYWNAGHLLGLASIEIEVTLAGDDKPTDHKLLQPDPDGPRDIDYGLLEATYGDTDRAGTTIESRRRMLRDEVRETMHPGGVLLIPSFAVERTRELLVDLMDQLPDPLRIDRDQGRRAGSL